MQASTHKTIVRGACGCAVAGVLVSVALVILAVAWARSPKATGDLRRAAAAALDTLLAAGLPATTVVFETDRFVLPSPVADEVLGLTGRLWGDTGRAPAPVPYGDTLPDDAAERTAWLVAGDRWEVDSLLALRSVAEYAREISAPPMGRAAALYQARAVLARARHLADSGAPEMAAWLLRAVVTVGHEQQSGPALLRAITGVRLERDALEMLSGILPAADRPGPERGAARADSLLGRLLETRRLVRRVARDAGQLDSLVAWARDPAVPLPLRDECIRAIGMGWVDDEIEVLTGVTRRRGELLTGLEDSLPDALTGALRAARRWATVSGLERWTFAADYEDVVAPLVAR